LVGVAFLRSLHLSHDDYLQYMTLHFTKENNDF